MPAAKRYWVTLNAPSSFLSSLPQFKQPPSKSRAKKVLNEDKKTTGSSSNTSKISSPALGENSGTNQPSVKINTGSKEPSTAGLVMNSINNELYSLDKTGQPVKKWGKRSAQFKTFTGFKIRYTRWKQREVKEPKEPKESKESKARKQEEKKSSLAGPQAIPEVKNEA